MYCSLYLPRGQMQQPVPFSLYQQVPQQRGVSVIRSIASFSMAQSSTQCTALPHPPPPKITFWQLVTVLPMLIW